MQPDGQHARRHEIARRRHFLAADHLVLIDAGQVDRRAGLAAAAPRRPAVVVLERADPDALTARLPFQLIIDSALPDVTEPVTTVPWPCTMKARSIAMRNQSAAPCVLPQGERGVFFSLSPWGRGAGRRGLAAAGVGDGLLESRSRPPCARTSA